jgi:hypothetical protein
MITIGLLKLYLNTHSSHFWCPQTERHFSLVIILWCSFHFLSSTPTAKCFVLLSSGWWMPLLPLDIPYSHSLPPYLSHGFPVLSSMKSAASHSLLARIMPLSSQKTPITCRWSWIDAWSIAILVGQIVVLI